MPFHNRTRGNTYIERATFDDVVVVSIELGDHSARVREKNHTAFARIQQHSDADHVETRHDAWVRNMHAHTSDRLT